VLFPHFLLVLDPLHELTQLLLEEEVPQEFFAPQL
jgi:hypothetical protein